MLVVSLQRINARLSIMGKITRRNYMKGAVVATLPALNSFPATATPMRRPAPGVPGIQLAHALAPGQTSRHRLTRQAGARYAIANVLGVLKNVRREDYFDALIKIKDDFAKSELTVAGVESHPVSAEKIKLGLPGRDEEIENYQAVIPALARAGIRMICYNFMAGLGPYRTRVDSPERGGALTTEFDNRVADQQGLTEWVKSVKTGCGKTLHTSSRLSFPSQSSMASKWRCIRMILPAQSYEVSRGSSSAPAITAALWISHPVR